MTLTVKMSSDNAPQVNSRYVNENMKFQLMLQTY